MVAYAEQRATSRVLSVLRLMHESMEDSTGHQEDLIPIYVAAVRSCVNTGRYDEAIGVYNETKKRGVKPDLDMAKLVAKACDETGQWRLANELLVGVYYTADIPLYASVISASHRAGNFNSAMRAFKAMQQLEDSSDTSDVIVMDALITAYTNVIKACQATPRDNWNASLGIVSQLVRRKCFRSKPSLPAEVFITVADICAEAGRHREAVEVVRLMDEGFVIMTPEVYNMALDVSERAQDSEQALNVLEKMAADERLMQCNSPCRLIFHTLVKDYMIEADWCNRDKGRYALALLHRIESVRQDSTEKAHNLPSDFFGCAVQLCMPGDIDTEREIEAMKVLHRCREASLSRSAAGFMSLA